MASAAANAHVPSAPMSLPPRSSVRTHCSVVCMTGSNRLDGRGGEREREGEGRRRKG